VGLSIMLRIYFVQQWFNLSDPGVEEALYESPVLQRFVGVDLGVAPAGRDDRPALPPSAEKHSLGGQMLDTGYAPTSRSSTYTCTANGWQCSRSSASGS
jgi:IS5 family transposase